MMDGGAERGGNDGWTAREGPPGRENGNSVRLMDGWDGMDGWLGWEGVISQPNPSPLGKHGREGSEATEMDTSEEHSQKNVALVSQRRRQPQSLAGAKSRGQGGKNPGIPFP